MLKEARTEVNAAQQNLREAIAAWETLIANSASGGRIADGSREPTRARERTATGRYRRAQPRCLTEEGQETNC